MSVRVIATKLGPLGMFTIRFKNARVTTLEHRPFVGVTLPLLGVCNMVGGGQDIDVLPGMVHVANGGDPFDCRMDAGKILALTVVQDKLVSVASQMAGEPIFETRLRECVSSPNPVAASFAQNACEIWHELRHDSRLLRHETTLQETVDTLVGSLVDVGTTRALGRPEGADHDSVADTAAEYIVEHLDSPLSRSAIAANTATSVRSLTRAFRHRYATSPLQFVRDQRLNAVNRALLVAEPEETTVTEVAMRFGFWHLGRFSSYYHKAFAESPSATLNKNLTPKRIAR